MNINFKQDQLSTILGQLNIGAEKKADSLQQTMQKIAKQAEQLKNKQTKKEEPKDSVEISDKSKNLYMAQSASQSILSQTSADYTNDNDISNENGVQTIKAGGLNISFQFDMFYELSSKVEAQMGKSGAERFASLGATVAETFQSNFNLSIDAVGSFMNGTEQSLAISNETTNAFFDAVSSMADLSPESLENFLKESDNFFDELKATYGDAEGAFDQIKETMQNQAKDFFAKVTDMRENAMSAPEEKTAIEGNDADIDENENAENADDVVSSLDLKAPSKSDLLSSLLDGMKSNEDNENDLISMFFKKDMKVSKKDYSDFLADFQNFAEKIKANMFTSMFNKPIENSNNINGLNIKA